MEQSRKLRKILVSAIVVEDLLKLENFRFESFQVQFTKLPDDLRVFQVRDSDDGKVVEIVVESESFEPVEEGALIPTMEFRVTRKGA